MHIKTNMLILGFLLIVLTGGLQVRSKQEVLESASGVVEYICSEAHLNYIKEVCELCSAEIAYTLPSLNLEELMLLYTQDIGLLGIVFLDFEMYMPEGGIYAVAMDAENPCVAVGELEEDPDFEELLIFFMGKEAVDMNHPEIFDDLDLDVEFLAVRYNETTYHSLSVGYTAEGEADVKDLEYELTRVYSLFDLGTEMTYYYGTVKIYDDVYLEFNIITDYNRKENEDFNINLLVNSGYDVGRWSLLVDEDSECGEIIPPDAISSLIKFPVLKAEQIFSYDEEDDEMKYFSTNSYFDIEDFALVPDIFLLDNTGVITIYRNSTCKYFITGNWEYLDYDIELTVYNYGLDKYEAFGHIQGDLELNYTNIEEDFYSKLLMEDSRMIPEFSPGNPEFLNQLLEMILEDPYIQLYFIPEISYVIFAKSLEYISGRVNGTVQTVIHSYVVSDELLIFKDGITDVSEDLMVSSRAIEISENLHFRSQIHSEIPSWSQGFNIRILFHFTDECEDYDFCSLLQELVDDDEYLIEGQVIWNTVYIDKEAVSFKIEKDVKFKEGAITIQFSKTAVNIVISGSVYVQVDSVTTLRFVSSISANERGESVFKGIADSQWDNVLEIVNLRSEGITMTGFLNAKGELYKYSTVGIGIIETTCLVGTCYFEPIELYLSLDNYKDNNFTLSLQNLTQLDFYNNILGYQFTSNTEIPFNMNTLSLPFDIFLTFSYSNTELSLSGPIEFCGVLGDLQAAIPDLRSGIIEGQIGLHGFRFANNNLLLSSPIGHF